MKINASQLIVELLWRQGIREVVGIPGAATLHLYDALYSSPIRHILARHEQGAAFIAQGIARTTGRAAVCIATSGPGATNLITAIADAKADSIPLVAITGQVSHTMIGTDAFQEVDMFGLTLPISKHNYQVVHPEELLTILPEAFRIAESGRPGPVVIDIPKNVQDQMVEFDLWPEMGSREPLPALDNDTIATICRRIESARRPVIIAGGGIASAEGSAALIDFAEHTQIPVATTLMGLGTLPCDHPFALGMIGMHGQRWTNQTLGRADLLIALGTRLSDRSTGKLDEFCPDAQMIHIDIDASEMNKLRHADLTLQADLRTTLHALRNGIEPGQRAIWQDEITQIRRDYPPLQPAEATHPNRLIRELGLHLPADTIITTDVGQHQMWVAQSYPVRRPRTLLTSGGLGTMGFGLPAAIGAAWANPGKKVVCFSGDGSILMNLQELATLADLQLDVTIVILNNRHLGLVRQIQQLFFERRYSATVFESDPDFALIAQGFGIPGHRLDTPTAPELLALVKSPGPHLIDARIATEVNVFPIVPAGKGNRDPQESELLLS